MNFRKTARLGGIVRRFNKVTWRVALAAELVALLALTASAAEVYTIGTYPNSLKLEFWNQEDGDFQWGGPGYLRRSSADWANDQIQSVLRGFNYWWEVLGAENTPAREISFRLLRNAQELLPGGNWKDSDTHASPEEFLVNGNYVAAPNLVWAYGGTQASSMAADAIIAYDKTETGFFRNGPIQVLPGINLETTTIHELGHTLGMVTGRSSWGAGDPELKLFESMVVTVDPYGNRVPVVAGQNISETEAFFFNGEHARSVYGDALLGSAGKPVPLTIVSVQKSHLGIDAFTMTHEEFRNYPYFNEVELAILQDLGFEIDRRKFFGRSIYTDGTAPSSRIENQDGFDSTSTYGVGLHLKASNREVVQLADLYSAGEAGTGIRIDGNDNVVVVDRDVTVSASGEYGMGLIVSNGKHNDVVHRGTISATATGDGAGTGVYLGFSQNTMGPENSRNSASESKYSGGYLVNDFDVSGPIFAGGNALWIDATAAVRRINLMAGTQLTGNIVSDALTGTSYGFYRPTLSFGYLASEEGRATEEADPTFHLDYEGNIFGATPMDALFVGGRDHATGTRLAGETQFHKVEVGEQGRVTVAGTMIAQDTIEVGGVLDSVGGQIVSHSKIVVAEQGRLSGTGYVAAPLVQNLAGGTMFAGNSIGTMTIVGDYESSGTLQFDVTHEALPQDASRFEIVGGTAVINGGVSYDNRGTFNFNGADPDATDQYQIGRRYTILATEAPGQLQIEHRPLTDDNLVERRMILRTDTDVSQLYTPGAQYYFAYVGRDVPYAELGNTPSQQAVGAYLDNLFQLDDGSDLANEVQWFRDSLDLMANQDQVLALLNQMSGELYASIAPMMMQQTFLAQNRLAWRLRHDQSRLDWCDEYDEPRTSGLGGWIDGFGTGGSTSANLGAAGYDYSAGGTQLVVTSWLSCQTMLGGYYTYTGANFKGGPIGSAGAQANEFGGLFAHHTETAYVLMSAGGGSIDIDARRGFSAGDPTLQVPIFESLGGDGAGRFTSIYFEYGRRYGNERVVLRPLTGLGYVLYSQGPVEEQGAALGTLQVGATSVNSLRMAIGLDTSWLIQPSGNLRLDARTLYMHDFLRHDLAVVTSSFAGTPGSGFVVQGAGIGRDFVVVGTALSRNLFGENVRVFAGYDLLANGQQYLNSGSGGIEVLW
jgi:uncharacterized protein with beta-barrel porin domain